MVGYDSLDFENKELGALIECIKAVKDTGFGEGRIIIRNGAIYRIQKIEDKIIPKD